MSETSDVTRPLVKALESFGCLVLRLPTGGYRGRMKLLPKGTPDLLVLPPAYDHFRLTDVLGGAFFGVAVIETKASHRNACKCNSCEGQRKMRPEYEKRGVLYLKERSVDGALRGLGLVK